MGEIEDSQKVHIMKKKMGGQKQIILIFFIIYLHIRCSQSYPLDKSLNLLKEEDEFQQGFTENPTIIKDPETINREKDTNGVRRPRPKEKLPPGSNCRKGRVWDEKLRKCVSFFQG